MDSSIFQVFTLCVLVTPVITVLGQCPPHKFGPSCRYDCHCKPDVTCNPESGCAGECAEGWDGPTCQRRNVAFKQTATQTPSTLYLASNAVDGKRGHSVRDTPCAVTAWDPPFTSPSEWTVALDQEYNISRFIIDLRQDCCRDRMINFTLSVGHTNESFYEDCYRDRTISQLGPSAVIQGQCSSPLRGDIVRIRTAKNTGMELCEVIIPVCAPGSWGEDCEKPCGHCWNNVYSGANGDCPVIGGNPQCAAGYKGRKCLTKCSTGWFGPDCNFPCGFCASKVSTCDTFTGNCPLETNQARCRGGYHGPRCMKKCSDGKWGPDCTNFCGHCWNSTTCEKSSGDCPEGLENPRCSAGYMGAVCVTRCSRGSWGENCNLTCSLTCKNGPTGCDATTGECIGGCAEGYEGLYCEKCSDGKWGPDCTNFCGYCWNGMTCDKSSGGCPEGLENPRCSAGYKGALCVTRCSRGTWGENCNLTCSLTCKNGPTGCDATTGECIGGCAEGYEGLHCEKCSDGKWGPDCTNVCGYCWNGTACNKSSGDCPEGLEYPGCSAGYIGALCVTRCSRGTWGENCKLTCSLTCKHGPTGCDATTGECIGGCAERHEGLYCETDVRTADNTGIIVGGAVAGIVVMSIALVGIVFILRNYRKQAEEHTTARTAQEAFPSSPGEVQSTPSYAGIIMEHTETSEEPLYATVDKHEYSGIRLSNMGEETGFTEDKI